MARKIFAKPLLREIRSKKGFTLTALAKESGYAITSLSKVERRANGLTAPKAKAISDILNVKFDDVFEFVDE